MKFDGTININTVVVAGTLLVSGASAYGVLDKRIAIIEQIQIDRIHRIERELVDLRKDVKELTNAVNRRYAKDKE